MMLDFVWPLVFCLLPLPWLLRRWLPDFKPSPVLRMPGFELSSSTGLSQEIGYLSWRKLLVAVIWLCLVIAAARPLWRVEVSAPAGQQLRNLMLVIDTSASMDAEDLLLAGKPASRLNVAKAIAVDIVENVAVDQVGLVVFGSHAQIHTPLTRDTTAVVDGLTALRSGLAGKGSALDAAVSLAVAHLAASPGAWPLMLILSDGSAKNSGPETSESAMASQLGRVAVHAVQVASTGSPAMKASESDDSAALQAFTAQKDSHFARVSDSVELRALLASISRAAGREPVLQTKTVWLAVYHWPLALALGLSSVFCVCLLWRRGG